MRKKMKDKHLQDSLSKKIDRLMRLAARWDFTGPIAEITSEPEIERIFPIREVDDLDILSEPKLRKRLTSGSVHRRAIADIIKALSEGHFVINVIAPEYSDHKDLVDLLISSALNGYYQLYEERPEDGKQLSPEEKERRKRFRRYERNNKVDNSIIANVDTRDIRNQWRVESERTPRNIDDISRRIIEEAFLGSYNFDPKDRTNCCYQYIRDYLANPFPTDPNDLQNTERNTLRIEDGTRPENAFTLSEFESRTISFRGPLEQRRHRMAMRNPSAVNSTIERPPNPGFPGLFFDERSNLPIRFDPSNMKSYMYPFLSQRNRLLEAGNSDETPNPSARDNFFRLMDNGMRTANGNLRAKWMLFVRLLSALQGSSSISIFHGSGFNEQNEFRGLPPDDPSQPPTRIPVFQISDEAIASVIAECLSAVGMTGEQVENIAQALRETRPEVPSFNRRTNVEVNAMSDNDKITYLIDEYLDDLRLGRQGVVLDNTFTVETVNQWLRRRTSANAGRTTWKLAPRIYNRLLSRRNSPEFQQQQRRAKLSCFIKISDSHDSYKDCVNKIAYTAGMELPASSIKNDFLLKEWISNRFGVKHTKVWPEVKSKLRSVSNDFKDVDGGFIKEAAVSPIIRQSDFFRRLERILRKSPKIDRAFLSNITSEYIIDLLIKHIQRKIEEIETIDYASESQNGIIGTSNFSVTRSFAIPFGREQQRKFNISTREDFERVLSPGTTITIVSDDGTKECFILTRATIWDSSNNEIAYSPNGPTCSLTLDRNPTRTFIERKYAVLIGSGISINGLKKSMYDQIYGTESISFDYEDESKKGIIGRNSIQTNQSAVTISFGQKEQRKFGIQTESDFGRILTPRTIITIIREEDNVRRGEEPREAYILESATIVDKNNNPTAYSPNGPRCVFRLDRPIGVDLESGKYAVLLGRVKTRSEIAEESHKANGVSLNLSVYPSWVPSPFDFREYSEKGYGHPNNAYNVNKALLQRLKLRIKYEKRAVYDSTYRSCIMDAIKLLDQEIAEMKWVLYKYSPFKYNMDTEKIMQEKDPYNSMMEGKGKADVEKNYDFFAEVSRRCMELTPPLDIGKFSSSIDSNVVFELLPPDRQEDFLNVRANVLEDWQRSKRFFILRNADDGLTRTQGNGFMTLISKEESKKKGEEGEESDKGLPTAWSPQFLEYANRLRERFAGEASVIDPRKAKNHIIIVSERAVPNLGVEPYRVRLQTNYISKEEIEALIRHYENVEISNHAEQYEVYLENEDIDPEERAPFEEALERTRAFTVPISFVRRVQDQLAGLSFEGIDKFLLSVVHELFQSYISSELSTLEVLDGLIREFDNIMENLKKEDPRLKKLNIRSEKPNVDYKSYVTEFGSEWESHVNSKIKVRIFRINRNNRILNFYRRMLDSKIYVGTVKTEKKTTAEGREEKTVVSLQYPPADVNNVWFDGGTRTDEISPLRVGKELALYASEAGFATVKEDLSTYLARNKITGAVKNLGSVVDYEGKLRTEIARVEADTKNLKCSYPVSIVLEGDPGTGKSIFGEVLATALDCKFYSTTLETIVYAGESKFRGVAEQNITDFLDCLRGLTDTVLLIDEIDKFLIPTGLSGSADEVEKALAKFQKEWEDTKAFAVYQENNLHLIFTTNYWERIVTRHGAFASRIGSPGRKFQVMLPASYQTLLKFFQGDAVTNNLLNAKCGGDAVITYYAKYVIENYDSDDKNKRELARKFAALLEGKNENFFITSSLLLPKDAEKRYAVKNGRVGIDAEKIRDFIDGWKMIKNLIAKTNEEQVFTMEDGSTRVVKPLELVCHKLEEKMRFTAANLGLSKDYPRTSMREMMNVIKAMFESHQNFMSGEDDLPFNWKTFYISICQTTFKGTINPEEIPEQDRDNPMFVRERALPRVDGHLMLKNCVYNRELLGDQRIPASALLTEEQFKDRVRQRSEQLKLNPIEQNGDGGANYFMERLSKTFFLENTYFDSGIDASIVEINNKIQERIKNLRPGQQLPTDIVENTLSTFLKHYKTARQTIAVLSREFYASKDKAEQRKVFMLARKRCEKDIVPMINVVLSAGEVKAFLSLLSETSQATCEKIEEQKEDLVRYLNGVDSHELDQIPIEEAYLYWEAEIQRAKRQLTEPGYEGLGYMSRVIVEEGTRGKPMDQQTYDFVYGREREAEPINFDRFKVDYEKSPELDEEQKQYEREKYETSHPKIEAIAPPQPPSGPPGESPDEPPSGPPPPPPPPPSAPPSGGTPVSSKTPSATTENITRDIEGLQLFPSEEEKEEQKKKKGKKSSTTDYYYKVAKEVLESQTSVTPPSTVPTSTVPSTTPSQRVSKESKDAFVINNDETFSNMAKALQIMFKLRYANKGVPMLEDEDGEFSQIISIHKRKAK